jgi:hypothetical protein
VPTRSARTFEALSWLQATGLGGGGNCSSTSNSASPATRLPYLSNSLKPPNADRSRGEAQGSPCDIRNLIEKEPPLALNFEAFKINDLTGESTHETSATGLLCQADGMADAECPAAKKLG